MTSDSKNVPVSHIQEWKDTECQNIQRKKTVANAIAKAESKTPLQSWTYDETMNFVHDIQTSDVTYTRVKLKTVDEYLSWLVGKEYITPEQYANHPFTVYRNVNKEDTSNKSRVKSYKNDFGVASREKILASYFFSAAEFKAYLDAVTPPGYWIMRRATMILSWIGMTRDEINNLKLDDVSFSPGSGHVTVVAGAKSYETNDKDFCRDLKAAYTADTDEILRLNYVTGEYFSKCTALEDRSCGYMIRFTKRSDQSNATDRLSLSHIFAFLKKQQDKLPDDSPFKNKRVKLGDIRFSGMFVSIYNQYDTIAKAVEECKMDAAMTNRYTLWASLMPGAKG